MSDADDIGAVEALRRLHARLSAEDAGPDYDEALRRVNASSRGRMPRAVAPGVRRARFAATACACLAVAAAAGFCAPGTLSRRADPTRELDFFVSEMLREEEFALRTVLADAD